MWLAAPLRLLGRRKVAWSGSRVVLALCRQVIQPPATGMQIAGSSLARWVRRTTDADW